MKRKLLCAFALIMLPLLLCFCGEKTREAPLFLSDIRAKFIQDEQAAEREYTGKTIRVNAMVYRTAGDHAIFYDGVFIHALFLHAYLPEDELSSLGIGGVVTLEGKVDKITGNGANGIELVMSPAKIVKSTFRATGEIRKIVDQEIYGKYVKYCIIYDENTILGDGEILVDLLGYDGDLKEGDMIAVEGAASSGLRSGYILTGKPGPVVYMDDPIITAEGK